MPKHRAMKRIILSVFVLIVWVAGNAAVSWFYVRAAFARADMFVTVVPAITLALSTLCLVKALKEIHDVEGRSS